MWIVLVLFQSFLLNAQSIGLRGVVPPKPIASAVVSFALKSSGGQVLLARIPNQGVEVSIRSENASQMRGPSSSVPYLVQWEGQSLQLGSGDTELKIKERGRKVQPLSVIYGKGPALTEPGFFTDRLSITLKSKM